MMSIYIQHANIAAHVKIVMIVMIVLIVNIVCIVRNKEIANG